MNQSHHPAKTDNTSQGEARFGRVMQAMTQIVCCADADGRATYFNQKWYEVTGLNESQSLNFNFLEAIYQSERDTVSQSWLSAVKERKSWEHEFRIIHKNNLPYWYVAYAQPCFDEEEQFIEWVVIFNNINKYKKSEIKLEQQEAQTEIQKYFERLTLALDAAKMGSWHWDAFTNKNIWTPYHDIIFGYEPGNGEHTYEDWATRVHPDDLPSAEAAWKTALQEHKDYVCEYRIVLPDNTLRWVESYGRYYYDDSGKALRMAGTVTDITERKKAQQALESSELRYSTLARISPVGIYRCDASANLLYVNQRWCEITGYTFDSVINQRWRAIVHPEDKVRVEAEVKRTLEQAIPFECEFRFQRPDNSVVWVFAQSVPETNADGVLIAHVGTVTDITHQKQSEKALRESEERFRSTFEQAAVGIAHADKNGKFIRVNQKLCDILGYTRCELLQRTFLQVTYADDLESDLKQVRNLLSGKIQHFSMEKRYIRKDGSVIWVEMTVSLVRQANGEPNYFLSVIKDISQRKQAQNSIKSSSARARRIKYTINRDNIPIKKT